MKKLFTSFAILSIVFTATAQYSYSPGKSADGIGVVTSDLDYLPVYIYFHNNSADSVQVIWRLVEDSLPSAWKIGLCDNVNCYYDDPKGVLTNAKTSDFVHAGDSMFLKAQFDPHCVSGEGMFRISAKPNDGSFNAPDTLTYRISALAECANGISEAPGVSGLKVYPNPATETVTISSLSVITEALWVQLCDLSGRAIAPNQLYKENMILGVQAIPAGSYLVQFLNADNQPVAVRRITKL